MGETVTEGDVHGMGAGVRGRPRLADMSPSQRRYIIPVLLGALILVAVIASIVN
ncbi:hypothetical protein [Nocardioides yefusunii]|uniref:Uncharacterized protein n=1 Tax=Nocardioides yefusunii TaxID=2500546 RepID=A0ABW1QZJ2_9ACTN|nr:hypothetical protein [Nocardioides yefusunii]